MIAASLSHALAVGAVLGGVAARFGAHGCPAAPVERAPHAGARPRCRPLRLRRGGWRGASVGDDRLEGAEGSEAMTCEKCKRECRPWPLRRPNRCSPKDWAMCIRWPG
jgi:hypothetical protein